jgi:hypothetical protein
MFYDHASMPRVGAGVCRLWGWLSLVKRAYPDAKVN